MKKTHRLNDIELINQVIAGSPGASDQLVDRFANLAWSILRRDLGFGKEEAEDLHQESFCRLLEDDCRRLRNWSGDGNFANYLGPIVRNLANDWFRKRSVRNELPLDTDEGDDDRPRLQPVCGDPGPEELAEAAEQRSQLHESMESLTPRDRELIRRRHLDDQSYREIAAAMDYNISSVGVILSRAEKRLKEAVDHLLEERRLAPVGR